MDIEAKEVHAFFLPLMAPGHVIPMVDVARLFVKHGARATLLTTVANGPAFQRLIEKAKLAGQQIELLLLPFHSTGSSGSSADRGQEFLTSAAMSLSFFAALERLREPLDYLLRRDSPSCIISDVYLPWTADVALGCRVPRLVFHGMGFFPLCVLESLDLYVASGRFDVGDGGVVSVPGLPHPIEMKRSQLHDSVDTRNEFSRFMDKVKDSELKSYGVVVNSFYEMEPGYADHYRSVMARKAWHIGPVCLCNGDTSEMAERGALASPDQEDHGSITTWLDTKPLKSVVYVCFGSLCHLTSVQLHELEVGLEDSGHPYVWVINIKDDAHDEAWDMKGEEEDTEINGLIIRGWAPQMLVLNHGAVGGFMTHCGWNSVMEGVSAGVPMITWPMFAEQFYNEKLVVDVLEVGVRVGAETWGMDEEQKPVVRRDMICKAVKQLMDNGGVEADGPRRRVDALREKARAAMEVGGSSFTSMNCLIDEIAATKKEAASCDHG